MRLALKTLAASGAAAFLTIAAAPAANAAYYEVTVPGTGGCKVYTQVGVDANPQHNPPAELDEDTDVGVRDC